ncbi:hypothetical protein D3C80_1535560 [compost metagenome]
MAVTDEREGQPHDEGADHVDRQGAVGEVATEQQGEQLGHPEPQTGADGTANGNIKPGLHGVTSSGSGRHYVQ